mmetsp:Transcript_50625/g.83994  ORF Transcript_50625/g.83994 Transcript_50625/m.83994 type:complete len:445 (+) Transcript_50625:737-2071(+)
MLTERLLPKYRSSSVTGMSADASGPFFVPFLPLPPPPPPPPNATSGQFPNANVSNHFPAQRPSFPLIAPAPPPPTPNQSNKLPVPRLLSSASSVASLSSQAFSATPSTTTRFGPPQLASSMSFSATKLPIPRLVTGTASQTLAQGIIREKETLALAERLKKKLRASQSRLRYYKQRSDKLEKDRDKLRDELNDMKAINALSTILNREIEKKPPKTTAKKAVAAAQAITAESSSAADLSSANPLSSSSEDPAGPSLSKKAPSKAKTTPQRKTAPTSGASSSSSTNPATPFQSTNGNQGLLSSSRPMASVYGLSDNRVDVPVTRPSAFLSLSSTSVSLSSSLLNSRPATSSSFGQQMASRHMLPSSLNRQLNSDYASSSFSSRPAQSSLSLSCLPTAASWSQSQSRPTQSASETRLGTASSSVSIPSLSSRLSSSSSVQWPPSSRY